MKLTSVHLDNLTSHVRSERAEKHDNSSGSLIWLALSSERDAARCWVASECSWDLERRQGISLSANVGAGRSFRLILTTKFDRLASNSDRLASLLGASKSRVNGSIGDAVRAHAWVCAKSQKGSDYCRLR